MYQVYKITDKKLNYLGVGNSVVIKPNYNSAFIINDYITFITI